MKRSQEHWFPQAVVSETLRETSPESWGSAVIPIDRKTKPHGGMKFTSPRQTQGLCLAKLDNVSHGSFLVTRGRADSFFCPVLGNNDYKAEVSPQTIKVACTILSWGNTVEVGSLMPSWWLKSKLHSWHLTGYSILLGQIHGRSFLIACGMDIWKWHMFIAQIH